VVSHADLGGAPKVAPPPASTEARYSRLSVQGQFPRWLIYSLISKIEVRVPGCLSEEEAEERKNLNNEFALAMSKRSMP
jgi:hypothetical protein